MVRFVIYCVKIEKLLYLNRRQPKIIPTKSDVRGVVSFTTGSCSSAMMIFEGFSIVFGTGFGLGKKKLIEF